MNYKLAKQLKDAGFPQGLKDDVSQNIYYVGKELMIGAFESTELTGKEVKVPTLSELIEACGDKLIDIHNNGDGYRPHTKGKNKRRWVVYGKSLKIEGETLEEAVAKLWLQLNSK